MARQLPRPPQSTQDATDAVNVKAIPRAVRHRARMKKEGVAGITRPAIRKLARRAGVKRISKDLYEAIREVMKSFLGNVVRDMLVYMEHDRRHTVTRSDVLSSLRKNGCILYLDF